MTELRGRRILVLGGNRFAGRCIVRRLQRAGANVTLFHRSPSSTEGLRVVRGDRNRNSDLDRALADDPEVVIDMCLYNGRQARASSEVLGGRGLHYVVVSTAAVYSHIEEPPWDEGSQLGAREGWGEYGRGKAEAEIALREMGANLDLLVLRPVYFVGPADPAQRLPSLFARASEGRPILIPGDGSARIQLIDVEDLAAIIEEAVERRLVGTFNVAADEVTSIEELLRTCAGWAAEPPRFLSCSHRQHEYDEDFWPFPNLDLWVSVDRLSAAIQHRCRSMAESIGAVFRWWRSLPKPAQRAQVGTEERKEIERLTGIAQDRG